MVGKHGGGGTGSQPLKLRSNAFGRAVIENDVILICVGTEWY